LTASPERPGRPRPEDFGLTAEEVERVEARHDLLCRRLVPAPLLVSLLASFAVFFAVCDCNPLIALMLALGLLAIFMTLLGLGATIVVFAVYPFVARRLSPRYRAVGEFRAAEERYEADRYEALRRGSDLAKPPREA
jgi:hypothetical protein